MRRADRPYSPRVSAYHVVQATRRSLPPEMVLSLPVANAAVNTQPDTAPATLEVATATHCPGAALAAAAVAIACRFPSSKVLKDFPAMFFRV